MQQISRYDNRTHNRYLLWMCVECERIRNKVRNTTRTRVYVRKPPDWRILEAERRRAHPEIRGVRWQKSDLDYLPIAERGPLPRRLIAGPKKERDTNWQLPDHILRGKIMDGFVYWERDAS